MMKRTNIHLRDDQRNWLYSESREAGVTSAELVRDMIDEGIARRNRQRNNGRRVRRTVTRVNRRKSEKAADR